MDSLTSVTSVRSSSSMYRIFIFSCVYIGFTYGHTLFRNKRQATFVKDLEDYELIIPTRVSRSGDHLDFNLHPHHAIHKRSTEENQGYLHYKINVNKQDILLQVQPNERLIAPSLVIERRKHKFNNVSDSTFRRYDKRNCHYFGEVVDDPGSRVALGLCEGLTGFFHSNGVQYFIEPVKGHDLNSKPKHPHIVYKRSALPAQLDPERIRTVHKRSTEDISCGVQEHDNSHERRRRWESHERKKRRSSTSPHRKKRSVSTEKYVETLVVVDPQMHQYYENEDLETYVLTIMNMVATMFHDASVGNSINIVLVRILIMQDQEEELVITHHADNTLKSFCKWQKTMNLKNDDEPNHHDVALLLTRHNICSRLNEPCSTLGLAQVSGMCQPHRSCNINEDTGLALAFTITHELGHNFGMTHDGPGNGCPDPPDEQKYIMSPNLMADSRPKVWSTCSKAAITSFIDRDWGYCLDDEPAQHQHTYPVLPPGIMYDANHQCRLQNGPDSDICTDLQTVCQTLWCRSENRCSTHLEAAAEGTICSEDKNSWCYNGSCVNIGLRPEAINGEWGEWAEWTPCTRSCGAGISHSARMCDNPRPSHGGKYCLGQRKRFRVCNTEKCPEGVPNFHQAQCEEFNYIPYKARLYEWEHVPTTDTTPCQLHCKPQNRFFSVLLKDIVTDGTPCTPGTRNMCISGRCRHVGCDYVIDSNAKEDRCGVCHGDGSSCKTIKDQYTETQGLGYVEATIIPVGARHIRVEEVAEANNFLALQSDNGEYYLNGHWFIQWSGDYDVAGTTVQYKRIGNKESVVAQGPLTEPLHVMLLLQSENPGVEFEYTVPNENATDTREPEFKWVYTHWTHCTASCGGGTQRSELVCVEKEAGIVEDKYCNATEKPDDKQKVCNDHLCPARWWAGPWQHCSVTCGENGVHHRTVICVRSLGPDEQMALGDEACQGQDKPLESEPCHRKDPCPGTSQWTVGEWSRCDGNPCAKKYRRVTCADPSIGCGKSPLPESEGPCSNDTCGIWEPGPWQECTRTCGGGVQIRNVECVDGKLCDPTAKPKRFQNCNNQSCPVTTASKSTTLTIPTTSSTPSKQMVSSSGTSNQNLPVHVNITSSFNTQNSAEIQTESTPEVLDRSKNDKKGKFQIPTHIKEDMLTNGSREELVYPDSNKKEGKELVTSSEAVQEVDTGKDGDVEPEDSVHLETMHSNRSTESSETGTTSAPVFRSTRKPVNYSDNTGSVESSALNTGDNEHSNSVLEHNNQNTTDSIHGLPGTAGAEHSSIPGGEHNTSDNRGTQNSSLSEHALSAAAGTENNGPADAVQTSTNSSKHVEAIYIEDSVATTASSVSSVENVDTSSDVKEPILSSLQQSKHHHGNEPEVGKRQNMPDILSHISFSAGSIGSVPKPVLNPPAIDQSVLPPNPALPPHGTPDKTGFLSPPIGGDPSDRYRLFEGGSEPVSDHKWEPQSWSMCSRHCGGGVRTRSVQCVNSKTTSTVNDILCDIRFKPTAIEKCNQEDCLEWHASEWSQCSATCGLSIQHRRVSCPESNKCDPDNRPTDRRDCDLHPCLKWVSGQWSQCTKTCGGGEQFRLVQCVNLTSQQLVKGCSVDIKPDEQQNCNHEECPQQKSAALSITCERNEMSSGVCHALRRMNQCHKRFVKLKCCKTCRQHKPNNKHRPKSRQMR